MMIGDNFVHPARRRHWRVQFVLDAAGYCVAVLTELMPWEWWRVLRCCHVAAMIHRARKILEGQR